MLILVINCGSSSLKTALYDTQRRTTLAEPSAERIPTGGHAAAFETLWPALTAAANGGRIAGVGHRVVHGGERFGAPTRIDDEVIAAIEALSSLAPLHNPANVAGIRAARAMLPEIPHVAVFDTAFHATLPRRARTYAIPAELAEKHHLRRYGFHGTSHELIAHRAAAFLRSDVRDLRIVSCHLGNGASVAAIEHGRSVETSMGMTPLEGLVMGTRAGDIDAGLLLHLMRAEGLDADALDAILNGRSGLAGLSGVGRDLRDIEARATEGDDRCRMAIQVFAHRVKKYIGAYAAAMGGIDVIAFAGGIGENSAMMRHRVAQRLDFLGARIDEDANRDGRASKETPVVEVSSRHSRVKILAVRTDENLAIAEHTARLVAELDKTSAPRTIPIAVSARHIHLTRASVDALFGEGYELKARNPLSQPGQFACEETLDIIGPKRSIEGVRILGPIRPENQVEISRTDEFYLGIDAPVRASGDTANTPGITLRGPKGTLTLREGVICAWRHIHMTPEDAELFGVKDRDVVEVKIDGGPRDLTFGDVMVRVSSKFATEMHIDTDEANAAEISSGATGMLAPTAAQAILRRRDPSHDAAD